MRHPAKILKVRFLGQAAALAVLAGSAAGCSSDVTRFGSLFEPTDNQNQIITGSVNPAEPAAPPPVPAYQTPSVASQPLPAPPGAVATSAPYVRPAAPTQAAATAVPAAPAPTVPAGRAVAQVPGWSAAGGTAVTVAAGDSIQGLSRRYGVPEQALLASNGLAKGTALTPGSRIVIPAYTFGAKPTPGSGPVAPAAVAQVPAAAPAAAPAKGSVYEVQPGDSLGRIAARHGLKSSELAAFNGFDAAQPIRIGQKIKIPGATAAPTRVALADQGGATANDAAPLGVIPKPLTVPRSVAAAPAPAAAAVPPTAKAMPVAPAAPAAPAQQPTQVASIAPQPVRPAPSTPAPSASSAAVADAAANGSFRWPVRGRVVSGYGVKANGERNDGINIEVPEGTPIKAAEGGEVIYAGNELKGYGNLVLIKHPSGFVSAYAHASEILVQRGDTIMRGQTVAKVGATGNVSRPQLHFELRQGNRPVDPLPFLSG